MTRIHSVLVAIIAFLLESACTNSTFFVHEVTVKAPSRPEKWMILPNLVYSVTWEDNDGLQRQKEIQEGDELRVKLRRGQSCSIKAWVFSGNARLKPAGAFYPRGLDPVGDSILELDYMAGYINEIAICLERLGKNPWIYPLERLYQELLLKAVDPWNISAHEVAEALAYGRFRISRYDRKAVNVSLPEGGTWIPESPFCKVAQLGTSQTALLVSGLTVFFESGRKLLVSVDEGKSLFQIIPRSSD